jgi:sugar phosphate isomerase/epimerase
MQSRHMRENGGFDWQTRLGVCTYSYGIHWRAAREGTPDLPFKDPIEFMDLCHGLGAAGVQLGIGSDAELARQIQLKRESYHMYFEGQVALPKDETDVGRFEKEIDVAKTAGAAVVRSAALSGRRYETFETAEAFRKFASNAERSLALAEPALKRRGVKLALENHKDWRIDEMIPLLKRFDSEFLGICVDTGNSIALIEDPMEVVRAYAPLALSVHLKDMGVRPYDEGFRLAEVPLGEGFLDIPAMVAVLLKANHRIWFSLEMITRDPLNIPCLLPKYWGTMSQVPASALAATLALVRHHDSPKPLPFTTGLDPALQLALEDEHVRRCFAYAQFGPDAR